MKPKAEENYSPAPFTYGDFKIEGKLLLNPARDVLLLLLRGDKKIVSDYKTTVYELRVDKGTETATSNLLKRLKEGGLDPDTYTELYIGVRTVLDQIVHKSTESIGHLQLPAQYVPSL